MLNGNSQLAGHASIEAIQFNFHSRKDTVILLLTDTSDSEIPVLNILGQKQEHREKWNMIPLCPFTKGNSTDWCDEAHSSRSFQRVTWGDTGQCLFIYNATFKSVKALHKYLQNENQEFGI
jgi:hypothetical protein